MEAWTLHCDGSALRNRSDTGLGAVLLAPSGERHTLSRAGGPGCNTEAEGRAMLAALQHAKHHGARRVRIYCDNAAVLAQAGGEVPTVVPRLVSLFAELRVQLASFEAVEMRWVPRHKNREADALARAALGLLTGV